MPSQVDYIMDSRETQWNILQRAKQSKLHKSGFWQSMVEQILPEHKFITQILHQSLLPVLFHIYQIVSH